MVKAFDSVGGAGACATEKHGHTSLRVGRMSELWLKATRRETASCGLCADFSS